MALWMYWDDFPNTWMERGISGPCFGKWYLMAWNYEMAIIMHEDFEPYDIPWVPPMFFTLGNLNCPECEVFQKFCMSDCLWLWTSVRLWFHALLLAVRWSLVLIVALFFFFSFSSLSPWFSCPPFLSFVAFPFCLFSLSYCGYSISDSFLASNWFIRTWLTWWSWRDQGPQFDLLFRPVNLDIWLDFLYGNALWDLELLYLHQDSIQVPSHGTSKVPTK